MHIHFSPAAAIFIIGLQTEQSPDRSVEVELNVCLLPELDRLILPWTGHVKVLSVLRCGSGCGVWGGVGAGSFLRGATLPIFNP